MIQDGFGNEVTADELVGNYWKWAHKVAGSMVAPSSLLYDDLVQEALIAVWKVSQRKPEGVAAPYITKAMRTRMRDLVNHRPMTGGDSKPGPKSRPKEISVDWQEVAEEDSSGFENLLSAADLLTAVEWAYHEGEILQALNQLPEPDRTYVYQRFWQGKTDTEIAAERGISNKFLYTRWHRTIQPKLLESLSYLSA